MGLKMALKEKGIKTLDTKVGDRYVIEGMKESGAVLEMCIRDRTICAATNPMAQVCLDHLGKLQGCQAHSTTILSRSDEECLRKLGIDVTCDAVYPSDNLYYNS